MDDSTVTLLGAVLGAAIGVVGALVGVGVQQRFERRRRLEDRLLDERRRLDTEMHPWSREVYEFAADVWGWPADGSLQLHGTREEALGRASELYPDRRMRGQSVLFASEDVDSAFLLVHSRLKALHNELKDLEDRAGVSTVRDRALELRRLADSLSRELRKDAWVLTGRDLS